MFNSKERGRLLLAVRVPAMRWTILIAAMTALWLVMGIRIAMKEHRLDRLMGVLPALLPLLIYLLHPRIRFFEQGVELPPDRDRKLSYLRWDQVERYSWDSDMLVLTGTTSVLAGGPVEGGSIRIPASSRMEVEQLLASKVHAKQ